MTLQAPTGAALPALAGDNVFLVARELLLAPDDLDPAARDVQAARDRVGLDGALPGWRVRQADRGAGGGVAGLQGADGWGGGG